MDQHKVVSRDEWLAARRQLLDREKEITRQVDQLNVERHNLPWVKVEKEYFFDTPDGKKSLADLFGDRSQLFVYHFMFSPEWNEGCVGCSFFADHVDGPNLHLAHHDLTFVAISRAPLAKLEAYKARMGWRFPWVSSLGSDFNYDFHVSFTSEEVARRKAFYNFEMSEVTGEDLHGTSVFFKDETGAIFHTYSAYGRGDERGIGAYMFLDVTPRGRNETGPNFNLTDWVKRHDMYEQRR
jgi:predicted dithiol-disulfide oxidoreductase (DUF899 family)